MSGQPVNTALDQRKFRDSYMANMRLRAELDDKNLQANKVFHRTGQVPSEMTDYRTTTEKISDIYKLKLDIQSELLKLTDVTEALAIVNKLSDGQAQFLAQNLKPITADLASRFKYGVTEAVFTPYFLRYIEELIRRTGVANPELNEAMRQVYYIVQLIPEIREQLDEARDDNAILVANLTRDLNNIVQDLPSMDQLNATEDRLEDAIRQNNREGVRVIMDQLDELFALDVDTTESIRLIREQLYGLESQGSRVETGLDTIQANMATSSDLLKLEELMETSNIGTEELADRMSEVFNLTELIPKIQDQLEEAKGIDATATSELKAELNSLIQDLPSSDELKAIETRLREAINEKNNDVIEKTISSLDNLFDIERDTADNVRLIKEQIDSIIEQASKSSAVAYKEEGDEEEIPMAKAIYAGEVEEIAPDLGEGGPKGTKKMYVDGYNTLALQEWLSGAVAILKTRKVKVGDINGGWPRNIDSMKKKAIVKWIVENNDTLALSMNPMSTRKSDEGGREGTPVKSKKQGSGVRGRPRKIHSVSQNIVGGGIARKEGRSDIIKISDIDFKKGILQEKRFIPFGRYVLNQNQLSKGIVALKRPSGAIIKDFPSERVSKNVHKIVNDIVGGNMPSFASYEGLGDEEKAYLHRLTEISNIENRLKIPAPSKDSEDQEIDRFEILNGEIQAGNDNPKMIKEFKLLIMKLSRKKLLPAGQVKDIIFELTSLGY